jgi:hypothetical protein
MFDRHKINVVSEKGQKYFKAECTLTHNYETLYLCLRSVDFWGKIKLEMVECQGIIQRYAVCQTYTRIYYLIIGVPILRLS